MVHQTSVTGLGQSDVVSALALNYHSTLLASSSADHGVTVIAVDPASLTFSNQQRQTWKAHDSAVLALAFAHPEFGTILATGAVDGSVKVWQSSAGKWKLTATLNDARGSLRAIEFGHKEFGLKLATLASDSRLRVYECLDPSKAADWSLAEDIGLGTRAVSKVESDGAWSVSWLKEHWWGERIATSAGSTGMIRLFHLEPHAAWSNFLTIQSPKPVSSLAFAPASGRSYQLLAAGSRDGLVRIYKLYPPRYQKDEDEEEGDEEEWRHELEAELAVPSTDVGSVKVDWNMTGTVLSTAGEDGKVRLWKPTYTGQWRTVAELASAE